MKRNLHSMVVALALAGASAAPASELVYSQVSDYQSTFGPGALWPAGAVNGEVADDFELIGDIDRVVASGFIWGTVSFQGVYVRFYEYKSDGTPGALQSEYFLTDGFNDGAIDVRLAPVFPATGKHFVSVQPVINYWYWWSSRTGAPRGASFYFRNLVAGQTAWQHGDDLNFSTDADVTFSLYGSVTGPARIDRLSANTLARSGYLEIFGANFDSSRQVLIGGLPAPVANWTSDHIVAYVPESAPLGTVGVRVFNGSSLPGNSVQLTVTARQPSGRVNWRFRMNGPYAQVRPVVAGDGTVYAIDAFYHLYALSPDGGLKWLARGAGDKGVAVGADGSIYVGSEDAIKAYAPDGTAKWTFVQSPRAFILLGVSVGPDGNIYAVGTEGLGVFSLTPAGTLRWRNTELYDRRIVDYGEIVFGPSGGNQQLYFYANNHLRALRLDGNPQFTLGGTFGQPSIGPDGTVHSALAAYSPEGALRWSFATPYPYNTFSPADLGSDGIHYFVQNLSQLFALSPNGSQRWHVTFTNAIDGPIVDPLNTQLVLGSVGTLDQPGFIEAVSARDGHELWRVILPMEDPAVFNPALGIHGFNQFVDTRARFSADGSTVYIVTATATGDNNTSKSFVYSINASEGALRPDSAPAEPPGAGLIAREGPGSVRVKWHGTPGRAYQVLVSTDLSDWSVLATVTAKANGLIEIVDTTGATPMKFYRAARP